MKIKLFMHLHDLPGAFELMSEQLTTLNEVGLLDEASEVHLCTNGRKENFEPAKEVMAEFANVHFHHTSDTPQWWEWPTVNFIKEHCDASDEEFYVMYFHLKGLSRPGDTTAQDWRKFMEYWIVENWQACVAKLDENFDTVGPNFIESPWPHYSGNFWWARASYIRKLNKMPQPDQLPWGTKSPYTDAVYDPGNFRYDYEAWIGTGNPVWAELGVSPGKADPGFHYRNNYPRELYATSDSKD